MNENFLKLIKKELGELLAIFDILNIEARFVGGVSRDFILTQKLVGDIDVEISFLTPGDFESKWQELESKLSEIYSVNKLEFNILTFTLNQYDIELSPIREEIFTAQLGHKNFEAKYFSTLAADESFKRRDFSINAISFSYIKGNIKLIDPFDGVGDLKNKKLKVCNEITFAKDPVRFLRAIRFMLKFDLSLDENEHILLNTVNLSGLSEKYLLSEAKKFGGHQQYYQKCFEFDNFIKFIRSKGIIQVIPDEHESLVNSPLYYLLSAKKVELHKASEFFSIGEKDLKTYRRLIKYRNYPWTLDLSDFHSYLKSADGELFALFMVSLLQFKKKDELEHTDKRLFEITEKFTSFKCDLAQIPEKQRVSYKLYVFITKNLELFNL